MKNQFHARAISVLTVLMFLSPSAMAADYYVVIGAFAKEANARKFTGYARNLYLEAYYTFIGASNLYYVHVFKTSEKDEARNWSLYLKHETGFKDAWILAEALGPEKILTTVEHVAVNNRHARYSGSTLSVTPALHAHVAGASEVKSSKEEPIVAGAETWEAAWTNIDDISYISNVINIASARKQLGAASGKLFTFSAETPDGKRIPAEVMLVNYEKVKKLSSFNTGEFVALRGKKTNQTVTVVCDVFGYRQATRTINLEKMNMLKDIKQNEDGVWEVKFKLKPMVENDISVMYNTTFYKDASVLEPRSQKQVGELLALMKSHPDYKILIHSHCNKGTKRAIKLPATSKGYFDIDDTVERTGSDKNLSKARAETIQAYLVDNGIASKRIDILGWGSMEMMVSPASADARINDRIEIELVAK